MFDVFNALFTITATIIFTVWLVLTFKEYNLFCLLEDIVDVRSTNFSKGHSIYIATGVVIMGSVWISVNYTALITFLSAYIDNPIMIVLMLIPSNITWMLVWNITFLLCVNAFILSREFQKCTSDLEIDLNENGALFSDIFYKTIERFRELTSVVNRMDSVFSFPIGIILIMTMYDMCGTIHLLVTGKYGGIWSTAVIACAMTSGFPLLFLSTLNYQVCRTMNS